MERCTRGAEVVVEVLFWTCPFLFSPLRRERYRRNALAWTRTTRGGARIYLVDSMACAVSVRVVVKAEVKDGDVEATPRSRRAMERCTRGAEL